jgi:hypothetical protein
MKCKNRFLSTCLSACCCRLDEKVTQSAGGWYNRPEFESITAEMGGQVCDLWID